MLTATFKILSKSFELFFSLQRKLGIPATSVRYSKRDAIFLKLLLFEIVHHSVLENRRFVGMMKYIKNILYDEILMKYYRNQTLNAQLL